MRKSRKSYVASAPKGRFKPLKGSKSRFGGRAKVLKLKHGGPKSTKRGAIKFFTEFPGLQKNR